MSEHRCADAAAIEELLRGAGAQLEVSHDLRPRVMDAARMARGARSTGRRARVAAAAAAALLLLYAAVAGSARARLDGRGEADRVAAAMAEAEPARRLSPWALVDVFFAIRSERANALRGGK